MSVKWPQELTHAVARRRVVILIGSGVSANSATDAGEKPPTWGEFLGKAYVGLDLKVPHIKKALSQYRYLEACDFLKEEYGNTEWARVVRESFSVPLYRAGEIHRLIFDLDARIVMSLNFDRIYENYAMANSENTIVVKNYYDADIRQAVAGSDRYIIKPHGSIDTFPKLIFTLDDYARARVEYASFYEILTALLHTHVFFCIGCGLSDPDIKLIFEDYRYKYGECPHFITLPGPLSQGERKLIEKTRGLNIIGYSSRNNHLELTESLKELVFAVNEKRLEISNTQNW